MVPERNAKSIMRKILMIVISLLVILTQLGFLYLLVKARDVEWLTIIVSIIGVICVIDMFNNNICSTYKMMWIILILIFPFGGSLLYLLLGNQRSFPKRRSKKVNEYIKMHNNNNGVLDELKKVDPVAYKHASIINNNRGLSIYNKTDVKFYNDIEEKHYAVLEDIKNAKRYIFIEMFIISEGRMLDELYNELKIKGEEGIEIKILYDDIGSKMIHKRKFEKRFKEIPNLKIFTYEPLGIIFNPSVNLRNHRKNIIIDGEIGYTGGDNIADEYANWKEKYGHWRDNALRIEGDAVYSMLSMFSETWYMSTKEMLNINKYKSEKVFNICNRYVMPYCDGPTGNSNTGYEVYSSIAMNATKYLYISTPYFIIDNEFIDDLIMIAKSNVDVRIMVPGIPDKKIVYLLTQSHYGRLLENGIKIYEYSPGFNHAKNYICDDKYSVVGTINIDYRSLYLHFENAIIMVDEENTKKIKEDYLNTLEKCTEIKYDDWKNRSLFKKIIQFILKIFSPLL